MTKKILPFQALTYNQSKVPSLKNVVAPPYDVISAQMQDELYAQSPYNFCRIDFTKEVGALRYEVAQKTFANWLSENILVKETQPGLYIHHHGFTLPDGRHVTRKGFLAVRRIEDFSEGGIKPHEKTLDAPKQDRLLLMRATRTQLSPVFSLYSDPEHCLTERVAATVKATPFMDFTTDEGERHQMWRVRDQDTCDFFATFLGEKPLFIADGHHRYETALNYRNEVLNQNPGLSNNAAVRHILMYFSNMNDDGLVILPIHRALRNLKGFDLDTLLAKLASHFTIQETHGRDPEALVHELEVLGRTHHAFLILTKDPEKSRLVSIARDSWLQTEIARALPPELARLDVTVLHRLILENTLGLSEASQAREDNIIYFKSTAKAIAETREGDGDVTFILNPTRIADMEAVATAGYKMPQKSTFFYPKIPSGLVLHDVGEAATDGF